jgi:hypothetical protein
MVLVLLDFRNIGAKLEHFKKLQGKLEFHQNKCHHGNAPDTRRQCAKATDQWAQGVAGRPNSQVAGPTLCALQEAVTRNLKLEVGGSQTRWPASHMARPAGQHLMCYRLKSVTPP